MPELVILQNTYNNWTICADVTCNRLLGTGNVSLSDDYNIIPMV